MVGVALLAVVAGLHLGVFFAVSYRLIDLLFLLLNVGLICLVQVVLVKFHFHSRVELVNQLLLIFIDKLLHLSVSSGLPCHCVCIFVLVLLFALPGSYIGWDALFLGLLLNAADMELGSATAVAVVVRFQQFVFMLLGGLSLGWLMRSTKKASIRSEL